MIKPAPAMNSTVDAGFVTGMASVGERRLTLMDVEALMAGASRLQQTTSWNAAAIESGARMTTATPLSPLAARRSTPAMNGISRRLYAYGSLPIAIFVAFSVWLWISLGDVNRTVQAELHQTQDLSLLAKDMQRQVVQVQQFLSDVSATRGLDGLDDGFKLAEEHGQAFLKGLDVFANAQANALLTLAPGELETLRQNFALYQAAGVAMAKAYVAGGPAQGNPLMGPFDSASAKLQQALDPFAEGLTAQLAAQTQAIEARLLWLQLLAIVVCAVSAMFVAVVGWRITRSIVGPLNRAVDAVHQIALGDFSHAIQSEGRDEIAALLTEVEGMRQRLVGIVSELRTAAESINTASAEIASGNHDLSARTEEAASNLEETAASMDQLTSTVRQSADSARQANQLASSASEIAVRGGSVVGQVVTTMDEINASSKRISDIIGVIDGIAFQTNILALNAAVEAARAGEQGRGFAVVAGEVRNLAQRSAEAAKEIKGLIGTSVDKVEAGSRLVAEAGQTMSEIVGSVQRVSDIIGEITAAAGEQSDGIGQVNAAVSQLDQVTQQNAALVEQSTAAAESLREQAARLAQVVQVLRIASEAAQPAATGSVPAPTAASEIRPVVHAKPAPAPAAPAAGKPAPIALERPALASQAPPRPAPAPKPVAASGDEEDWESF